MNINVVRAEFARRAKQFHLGEDVCKINLWGLFAWDSVSTHIQSGKVIPDTGYTEENKIIWCKPSKEEIENHIKPLMEKDMEELTALAGWM